MNASCFGNSIFDPSSSIRTCVPFLNRSSGAMIEHATKAAYDYHHPGAARPCPRAAGNRRGGGGAGSGDREVRCTLFAQVEVGLFVVVRANFLVSPKRVDVVTVNGESVLVVEVSRKSRNVRKTPVYTYINLTYSRCTSSLPSCLWSLRIFPYHPSSHALRFFITLQVQQSCNSTNG